MRENWDDLRFLLAVAEEGSVSGAARRLGVNHATVLRRIASYEATAGVEIFDRTAQGYQVAPAQMRVIEAAREVDRAVQSVGRMLQGARAPLVGEVRITSTDSLCQLVLPPILAGIRAEAPDLRIELICTNAHLDLGRTHAELTVRPAERLAEDLVGERVAEMAFALYRQAGGEGGDGWLGLAGPPSRAVVGRWMDANVPADAIIARADSFLVLGAMAAGGQGKAILPRIVGDRDPRLMRVDGRVPPLSAGVWVASHVDLAAIPRIAALRRAVGRALMGRASAFQGSD